jgi:hypothetical protein
MATRKAGTNRNGGPFTEDEKKSVWEKGTMISGILPSVSRRDSCGARMDWKEYGNRNSV